MVFVAGGCGDDDCKKTLTCPSGTSGTGGSGGATSSSSSGDGGATTSGMGGMGAPNGTACTDGSACQSGVCADDVCCDAACEGTCESCNLSGTEGTCTPHADGEDPENECGVASCDGAGACQVANALWGFVLGNAPNQSISAVAVDTSNNIYVAGSFMGSITIENTTLNAVGSTYTDIFVAKFAATGALDWAVKYGDAELQTVNYMSVGPRVFIGGDYRGAPTFTNTSLANSTRTSWYVAALNTTDGTGTWATGMPDNSTTGNLNRNYLQGLVHAGANFYATTRYGNGITGFEYTLRRYPSNGGSQETSAVVGGSVTAMGRTASGSLLIGGGFGTGFNVLGGTGLTSNGATDGWVARVTASLSATWATSFGGVDSETVYDIAELPNGEIVASGHGYGDFTVGADNIVNQGERDGFVVRLSSSGGIMGGAGFGGTGDDYFDDIAVGSDHVVIVGSSDGPLDIGGPLPEGGDDDGIVIKLDASDLSVRWVRRAGGLLNQLPRGVAVDALDRIAIGGIIEMDMTLGGLQLQSVGNQDAFLIQLTP